MGTGDRTAITSNLRTTESGKLTGMATHATLEKRRAALDSLREGATRTAAAQAAGVARQTIYKWINSDPEFAQAAEEAQLSSVMAVEDAVFRAATDPEKPNMTAAIFFLLNRASDRWQDRRNLNVTHKVDAERLQRIEQMAERLGVLDEVRQIVDDVPVG